MLKTLFLLSIILNGVLSVGCNVNASDCTSGCVDSYFC